MSVTVQFAFGGNIHFVSLDSGFKLGDLVMKVVQLMPQEGIDPSDCRRILFFNRKFERVKGVDKTIEEGEHFNIITLPIWEDGRYCGSDPDSDEEDQDKE